MIRFGNVCARARYIRTIRQTVIQKQAAMSVVAVASLAMFSACGSKAEPLVSNTGSAEPAVTADESQLDPLPPLDLSAMRLWDFSVPWTASQWDNPHGALPWRYDHVTVTADGTVTLRLDADGAPELQAVNGTTAHANGLWEADVTLPTLADGVIVAPLWLYNAKTKDEIDFEFVGTKGLQLTVHNYSTGSHRQNMYRAFWGENWSGRRVRLGISVDQARQRIEMQVNGKTVHVFAGKEMGFFPTAPMRPLIEMWAVNQKDKNLVNWAGKWQGEDTTSPLLMQVHGYAYKPLGS